MIFEPFQGNEYQKYKPAFKGAKFDVSGYCLKHPMIQLCKHREDGHHQSLLEESTEEVPPAELKYTAVMTCPLCKNHASTSKPKQLEVVSTEKIDGIYLFAIITYLITTNGHVLIFKQQSQNADQTSSQTSKSSHSEESVLGKESILDYPFNASPNTVINIFSPSSWEQKSRKDLQDVLALVVSKGNVPSLPMGVRKSKDESKVIPSQPVAAKKKEYTRSNSKEESLAPASPSSFQETLALIKQVDPNGSNKAVLQAPLSLDTGRNAFAHIKAEQLAELPFKVKKANVGSSLNLTHAASASAVANDSKEQYQRMYRTQANSKSLEPSSPVFKSSRALSLRKAIALASQAEKMEEVPVTNEVSIKSARRSSLQEETEVLAEVQRSERSGKSNLKEALALIEKYQKSERGRVNHTSKKSSGGRDISVDSRRTAAGLSLSSSLTNLNAVSDVKKVSFHHPVYETRNSQLALSRRHSTGAGQTFSGNGTKFLSYGSDKVERDPDGYKAQSFIRCNFILNCKPDKQATVNKNSKSQSNSKITDKSRGKGKTPLHTKAAPKRVMNPVAKTSNRYEVPFNASTGMCTRHPWIPLAVKKRSGGWKTIRDECPLCKRC